MLISALYIPERSRDTRTLGVKNVEQFDLVEFANHNIF